MPRTLPAISLALFMTLTFTTISRAQSPSPAKKFAVGGETIGLNGILRVNVDPSLDGPLTVEILDSTGAKVPQPGGANPFRWYLPRNRNSAKTQIALAKGQNQITVTDSNDATETVTVNWQPDGDYPVPAVAGNAFDRGQVQKEKGGKIWAEVERIIDRPDWGHLRVHIDNDVQGYRVAVRNSKEEQVDYQNNPSLERGVTEWSSQVKLDSGANTITVTTAGITPAETLTLTVPAQAATFKQSQPADDQGPPEYDWGRVRGYFASGVIFSKEREDFSKTDIFLDFTLDKTYLAKRWGPFQNFNTFFNARLTSIPVTAAEAQSAASPSPTPAATESPTPCNTADCTAFITSRKAAMMQAGIYLPMYWPFMMWDRNVERVGRSARRETNALFVAPLAKGGILTTTGQQTAEAKQFGQDDIFNFYSFGGMIGHFRLHGRGGSQHFHPNRDVAPELISWLSITYGRWENFEVETPTGMKDATGHDILWRQRPWRWEALGRLKIPETPFIIGFDGNFGKGPDDLRFIFGTRFDMGKILHTLRVAAADDTLGRSPSATTTPATSN